MTRFKTSGRRAATFGFCAGAVMLAATILVLCGGCGRSDATAGTSTSGSENGAADHAPHVETITVETQDLFRKIEMPGTVEGDETVELVAKVGGYLEAIHVDIGDEIKKGQVLAELFIPEMDKELEQRTAEVARAKARVEQARAAIRQAEAAIDEAESQRAEKQAELTLRTAEHKRVSRLVERSALQEQLLDEARFQLDAAEASLSTVNARVRTAEANLERAQRDLESAQAEVEVAEAQRARVETMLGYAKITAPFDGVVTKRWVHPGAYIHAAEHSNQVTPLLSVANVDHVRISLDLPMAEVKTLQRGCRVLFDRINVLPDERIEGQIARFAESLDRTSRMMRVEIDLPNPERKLRPGYYGYVTVFLQEHKQTPVVPSSAIVTQGNEAFVYVVDDGMVQKRAVQPVYQDGIVVGVGNGLRAGELVVRAGGGELRDGQPVAAMTLSPAASGQRR